jgi:hypothetical protein
MPRARSREVLRDWAGSCFTNGAAIAFLLLSKIVRASSADPVVERPGLIRLYLAVLPLP